MCMLTTYCYFATYRKKELKKEANEFTKRMKAIESCNQRRLKEYNYNNKKTKHDINIY